MIVTVKETGQVFKSFPDYMRSFYWQDKVKAFKLHIGFKGVCPFCKKKKKRIDVHHRIFKNVGNEPFEDLLIICSACYSEIHPEYQRTTRF